MLPLTKGPPNKDNCFAEKLYIGEGLLYTMCGIKLLKVHVVG